MRSLITARLPATGPRPRSFSRPVTAIANISPIPISSTSTRHRHRLSSSSSRSTISASNTSTPTPTLSTPCPDPPASCSHPPGIRSPPEAHTMEIPMPAPPPAEAVLARAFRNIDLEGHDLPPSPTPSSPRNGKKYALATELVYTEHGDQYNSSSMPIYQTATFKQTSADGAGAEYDYTRSGNPTRSHLERHLAKITASSRCLVVSSGMAALDVISRLLRPGDEVITGDDLYGGTNRLLKYLATHGDIVVHHIDTTAPETSLPPLLTKDRRIKLVLLESPTNPLIKICDIPRISAMVHETHPDAIIAVDNTMLSPYLQTPLTLGADIVYESGTKYLSGHHDLMAGVICTNSSSLAEKLYFTINASGCALSPFDSWLLLRGVKTLSVRIEKQQSSAQQIAHFLEDTCGFKVRYPGLKSHPQYKLHNSMARGAGAVLSFETGDVATSEKVVEATRLWAISVSFGCVNSLISMPCMMSHASIDKETRKKRELPEDLIRLCVGIEDVDDLIDDLQTALVKANAVQVTVDGICPKKPGDAPSVFTADAEKRLAEQRIEQGGEGEAA